ncbi:MAG: transglycosylase domain-containing protein [Fimbriimonas sp.]
MASSPSQRKGRRRSPWKRRLKLAITLFCLLFSGAVIGLFSLFMVKYREAEDAMASLGERMAEVSRPPSRILTSDGKVLFQISEENRVPLKLSQIPKHVQQAILAAEDKRFYDHSGVDATGLLRAFFTIFKEGRVAQGGSTITMQLAKRLYSGNERTFMRKVQDIAFATAMEREIVNKNRILELYLNQVYFGEGAHGVGAASKVYFNKPIDKMTVSDAALIARCVRLPSRENPIHDLDLAMRNRDVVLGIMRDEKMIDQAAYEKALAESPKINKNPPKTTAFYPAGYGKHFVKHVREFLDEQNLGIDLKRGGYTVYTTLDSRLQKLAEKTVRDVVKSEARNRVNTGAFVAIDKDGRILCEVGGMNYDKDEYNIVTHGQVQPGSAFKAIVYGTALREGVLTSPGDMLSNAPISIYDESTRKYWTPRNSASWERAGSYTFKQAFYNSINLPAIHTSQKVGFDRIVQASQEVFGIRSHIEAVNSMALGVSIVTPLEMAEAYSVFMLQGDRVRPIPVTRVVGADGELVKSFTPQKFVGVLDPSLANIMDDVMHATVITPGATAYRELHEALPEARGKTGTTNDAKDAWFCGYVDGVVGIGWVGNQQKVGKKWKRFEMASSVYGGTVTTKIWRGIMKSARVRFGSKILPSNSDFIAVAPPPKEPERVVRREKPPTIDEEPTGEEKPTPTEREKPKPEGEISNPIPPIDTPPGNDAPPGAPNEDAADVARREEERQRRADERRERELERERDREREKERREREAANSMISVEICVDSGRLATMYCPETVSRQYEKGKAPRRRCRIHGTDD